MTIADGKVEAKVDSAIYDVNPSMRKELHDGLNDRFLADVKPERGDATARLQAARSSQTQSPVIIMGLCSIATSLWPHFVASPQRMPVRGYRRRGPAVVNVIDRAPPLS
jgi:hypothetical protein